MSDTEAQSKTEDVQMDTVEDTPAVETPVEETKTEEEPVAEVTKEEEATNGDAKPEENEEESTPAKKEDDAADDEEASAAAPVSKKSKAKNGSASAGPASKRKGQATKANASGGSGESHSFTIGDVVLTKLKGYPLWPSIIVDPDTVPEGVRKQKPSGGKFLCSQFFPVGDYAWSTPRDLKALKPHEITAYLQSPSKTKKSELYEAYRVAEDPSEWIKDMEDRANQVNQVGEDEDELAEEDEEEEETAPASKKRKRISATDKKGETKAKKAKLEKLAKSKSKETVEDEDEVEEPADEPVSKKAATKSKAKKETKPAAEDVEAENGDDDPLAKDDEAKKVKEWRHKLQRAFLGKGLPSEDEMSTYDQLFTTIEQYTGMTVDYLAYSKIGKVMKKIAALENVPKNEDYKITERASELMRKWHEQVGAQNA